MKPPSYITRRQIHHWINRKIVAAPADRTSGYQGNWSPEAVAKLTAVWKLRQLGFDLGRASWLADEILASGYMSWSRHTLSYGVTVEIEHWKLLRDD